MNFPNLIWRHSGNFCQSTNAYFEFLPIHLLYAIGNGNWKQAFWNAKPKEEKSHIYWKVFFHLFKFDLLLINIWLFIHSSFRVLSPAPIAIENDENRTNSFNFDV